MAAYVRPTYQAVVNEALNATGASTGWLLAVVDGGLRVLATAGLASGNGISPGTVITATGAQGYVMSSGQPAALMPQPNDAANDGAGGYPGVPTSVLAAPCGDDAVLGVLELASKEGASPFTFADIEAVSGLATVAGAAMLEADDAQADVVTPAELAAELERLATNNPKRYADVARMVESLLGQEA
jgi:GAF domain-containing protein